MGSRDQSPTEGNTDGTQAIRRAAAILRRLGRGGTQGASLADITQAVLLPRSTTHRILKCLVDEGLVRHDTERRRYFVGQLTYELGLTVTGSALEVAKWRVAVDRVAQRTGVTAYLLSRSGIEAACVLKTEGNSVIRVIPVEVGQRRFLGVGAGATALLAALDEKTRENIIRTIEPYLPAYSTLTVDRIHDLVAETQRIGYTVSRGNVAKDVVGIGMAIPSPGSTPHLALSVAGLASQVDERGVGVWAQVLRQEINAVLSREG
ncbi:IclR family transcriptional regulator [Mesorhizobium sp. L-8-10]|uniref:IclR family transcriptional regulator n=1 Tax=Mesorhizobium sp. L-8-10 TaxID=2744523 RepID=UPI001928B0D4|nr:helix-turn-helix domain-containing protein [Mesorhizobium sp. L-8-10]BCH35167.1 IclR family transcriptional regulator [Mesorhizobium sp. L-8-10]